MGWRAATMHGNIGPGTVLSIFADDRARGAAFTAGVCVSVRLADGSVTEFAVLEATGASAVIQRPDQTQWHMARVDPNELLLPPADTGGAPATYWQVQGPIC